MKKPHISATIVVTTPQQRKVIEELERKHLEDGGSMLAQVYHDGLRLRVLTRQQTSELRSVIEKALGQTAPPKNLHISAFGTQKGAQP